VWGKRRSYDLNLSPYTLAFTRAKCKKYRAKRSCDNHVIYQLKLRSLRDTLE
jgi:hypothetical protein